MSVSQTVSESVTIFYPYTSILESLVSLVDGFISVAVVWLITKETFPISECHIILFKPRF